MTGGLGSVPAVGRWQFAAFALRHAKAIVFAAVALAVLGFRAYTVTPQSIFPPMSFSRIDVVAEAGDLPPDRVRVAVTRPLEAALQTLPAVLRSRATSTQGAAEIVLDFDPKTDPRVDLEAADQAIGAVRAAIPAAKNVSAVVVSPNAEPVVSYGITSSVLSQAALHEFVETRVLPAFAGTRGLGRITSVGGAPVEYHVDLDPSALAALGLGAGDVAAAVGDAGNVQSVGTVERRHQRYVLLVDTSPRDARGLAAVPVPLKSGGTVPLGSLATVSLGVGPETAQASVDGVRSVNVSAFALPGADAVTLARAVDARFAAIRGRLPADVQLVKFWDQTRLIVASQTSLRDAILLGALLAVLVIYLFLRSLRMTLVAAAVIPLAMAIAILAMQGAGQTLNLMSVGGLAVAVGLIIDDAIVVIEAIARTLAADPSLGPNRAIARAGAGIARAMIASTATTVVVFLPLGLLTGVSGFFFRALAFTLAASLIISLVLALFVAPILARWFLGAHAHDAIAGSDRLERRYTTVLRWALDHRAFVYGAAGVVLVVTALLLGTAPSDFLPKLDEGQFEIKYTLPPGASLATSDEAARTMEGIVRADPAVEAEGRLTGVDTNGYSPTQTNTGTIRISLAPARRERYDAIAERLRARIAAAVPAASLDFHQLLEDQINDLSGAPQPIEIAVAGPDQRALIALADRITAAISSVHGVVDAFDGVVYDDPALRVVPQTSRLAALGLGRADLTDALTAGAQGSVASQVQGNYAEIPVRVRVAGTPDATALPGATIVTKGGATALGTIARIENAGHTTDVNEENGSRLLRVSANIENASLSSVVAGIRGALAGVPLPPGYTATIGGAYETQRASFTEFAGVIAIAIVLVFGVMLATFGSLRLPLVILTAIPLALIGVALGLAITRTPVNVSSFMGLLLLVGIVVKNGILLIDVANRRRALGDDIVASLLIAGSTRLRPILMTTLAAIGGLLPLALGIGSGAEMEKPLAIAVIGGLSTATLFTLVLIPVLYAAFAYKGSGTRRTTASAAVATLLAAMLAGSAAALPARAQTAPPTVEFAGLSLAEAQSRAIGASPDVAIARASLAAARAAFDQARGAYGLAATGAYTETPQGAPEGTIAQRLATFGAQVTVGDVLAYAPAVAQANASLRAAGIDVAVAERAERVKTIGLYYAALKARRLAQARAGALASANAFADAARKRFAAGDAPRIDVVRADVAVARAQSDLAHAGADDGNATDALARETQVAPGALGAPAPAPLAAARVLAPDAAIAAAMAVRGDLRSANESVSAARAAVATAQRAAIPPVTVSAGYTRGVDSGVPISGPTVGATVAIPLSGSLGAKVRAQRAALDAAIAKRDAVQRQIALEVGAAARNAAAAVEAQRAGDAALNAARAELEAMMLGYRGGASTSLDVSTARATFAQAEVDALGALYDRLQAQATLDLEMTQ